MILPLVLASKLQGFQTSRPKKIASAMVLVALTYLVCCPWCRNEYNVYKTPNTQLFPQKKELLKALSLYSSTLFPSQPLWEPIYVGREKYKSL